MGLEAQESAVSDVRALRPSPSGNARALAMPPAYSQCHQRQHPVCASSKLRPVGVSGCAVPPKTLRGAARWPQQHPWWPLTCAAWVRAAPVPRGRAPDGGGPEQGEAGLAAVVHGHAAAEVGPELRAVRGVGDDGWRWARQRWRRERGWRGFAQRRNTCKTTKHLHIWGDVREGESTSPAARPQGCPF